MIMKKYTQNELNEILSQDGLSAIARIWECHEAADTEKYENPLSEWGDFCPHLAIYVILQAQENIRRENVRKAIRSKIQSFC